MHAHNNASSVLLPESGAYLVAIGWARQQSAVGHDFTHGLTIFIYYGASRNAALNICDRIAFTETKKNACDGRFGTASAEVKFGADCIRRHKLLANIPSPHTANDNSPTPHTYLRALSFARNACTVAPFRMKQYERSHTRWAKRPHEHKCRPRVRYYVQLPSSAWSVSRSPHYSV